MNRFLHRLVQRSLGAEPEPIRPRLPEPFEPPPDAGPGAPRLPEQAAEAEAAPRRVTPPPAADPAPRAVTPHTSTEPEQRLVPPAPRAAPELPKPPAAERTGGTEREARPRPPDRAPGREIIMPSPSPQPEPRASLPPLREREQKPAASLFSPVEESERGGRVEIKGSERLQGEPERAPAAPAAPKPPPPRPESPRAAPEVRSRSPATARRSGALVPAVAPPALDRAPAEPPPLPRVQVHIGRVEVRAVVAPPAPTAPPPRPGPALSLDDYLKRRDGGSS